MTNESNLLSCLCDWLVMGKNVIMYSSEVFRHSVSVMLPHLMPI